MPKIKKIDACKNGNADYTMLSFEKDWENGIIVAPFALDETPEETKKHLKVGDSFDVVRL